MSKGTTYLLVSLPTSIAPSGHADEALAALGSTVTPDVGSTYPFAIPEFKIGTLDALVQQADELAKLEAACQAVVAKVGDSLKNILDGDDAKAQQQKTINDKPVDQYLRTFAWNRVKYRADKSIKDLLDTLQKELQGIDNDVKAKYSQYNQTKSAVTAAERKRSGNLSTKSLVNVVDPKALIQDSEYLDTHLIAVPNTVVKDFYKSYEELAPMVVPRSANELAKDDEFTLVAVTTFKKHSPEFIHKCREKRWTPRDYKFKEGGREEEAKEADQLARDEKKLWGEALRLGRTGYSESAMIWIHVLALRVFVETVLRYGLPPDFVCGLVQASLSLCTRQFHKPSLTAPQTNAKKAKNAKPNLDAAYSYLGGNAFGRDSKGRVKKDDSATTSDMQQAGHVDQEYTAYVYYEFEIV